MRTSKLLKLFSTPSSNEGLRFDAGVLRPVIFESRILLREAYRKTNIETCYDIIDTIRALYTGEITQEEYFQDLADLRCRIDLLEKDGSYIDGYYDIPSGLIIVRLTLDFLKFLCSGLSEEDLQLCAKNLWVNLVHEDTHKQQTKAAKPYCIYTNYKGLKNNKPSVEYFDQVIEADAYGREVGARLSTVYGLEELNDKTATIIFRDINSNTIKDDYSNYIIHSYKDPRVSEKNTKAFFRALYDFLTGNED